MQLSLSHIERIAILPMPYDCKGTLTMYEFRETKGLTAEQSNSWSVT